MVSLCRIEGLSGLTIMPQCLSSAWKEGSGWLHNNQDFNWPIITNNTPRDWSFITGLAGKQQGNWNTTPHPVVRDGDPGEGITAPPLGGSKPIFGGTVTQL